MVRTVCGDVQQPEVLREHPGDSRMSELHIGDRHPYGLAAPPEIPAQLLHGREEEDEDHLPPNEGEAYGRTWT